MWLWRKATACFLILEEDVCAAPHTHSTSIQWTPSDGAATVSQGLALGMWQPGTVTLLLSPWKLWSSRVRGALLKQLTGERLRQGVPRG